MEMKFQSVVLLSFYMQIKLFYVFYQLPRLLKKKKNAPKRSSSLANANVGHCVFPTPPIYICDFYA